MGPMALRSWGAVALGLVLTAIGACGLDRSVPGVGAGGSSQGGSGGTGGIACSSPSDCPPSGVCVTYTCTPGGQCVGDFEEDGFVVVNTSGDCMRTVCDGNGQIVDRVDEFDYPIDVEICTTDFCADDGTPMNVPAPAGTPCGNSLSCNAAGQCAGCTENTQCPGGECFAGLCNPDGTCGQTLLPDGSALTDPTPLDCKTLACMGGVPAEVPNELDLPADADFTDCVEPACLGSTLTTAPITAGSGCTQGNGNPGVCDALGTCVECLFSTDCPVPPNPCLVAVCGGLGVCSVANAPSGTSCNGDDYCSAGACVDCTTNAHCVTKQGCPESTCSGGTCSDCPVDAGPGDGGGGAPGDGG